MPEETNKILNELEQGTEMGVIQREKILQSIDGLEPALEGLLLKSDEIAKNTVPKDVQRVTLEAGEQDELATQFFTMLKGKNGKDGHTPTVEELVDIITPLIPEVKDGHTPTESELIELIIPLIPEPLNGIDGQDYILTDQDKQEIAQQIEVPIVEKVIEKTEVIKEISKKETADQLLKKLETLNETLDYSKLKNKPDIEQLEKDIQKVHRQSSKTYGLKELEDVSVATPTNNQTLVYNSTTGKWENQTPSSGSGTVTSVSVVTANGFTGVVANATTTPAITIDASGLDATKLADGSVTNTEFQYINTLTSNAQTQINAKMTNPMTSKNDIIIGDTGGVPIRLAENNTADPFALISQGNGTSLPISWVKTIGTNAVNGINNATNLITASNPVIEATGLTSILSTYQAKRVYADYAGSANVSAGDTYIALSGSTITATLQTPTAGEIHYFINTSATVNTIDTSGGEVIGNQATQAGSISIQPGEVLGVVGDGSNWLYLYARSHSDLYVPTLTAVANITTLTMRSAHWERVGNKVTVDLVVDAEPSANNTQTTFGIDIPLAKNFINNYDVIGMGHSVDGTANQHGLAVYADTTNDRAECTYYETHGATDTLNIHFSYMIDA